MEQLMIGQGQRDALGRGAALWSIQWRWLLIPLTILIVVATSYGASSLKFAGDYRVFFGADNPDFIANENAQGTFGKPDNVAFVLIPSDKDVYTDDTIRAVHMLTEQSWTLPFVSRVDSLTNFQNTIGEDDDLIVEDLLWSVDELSPDRIEYIESVATTEPLINGFVVSRDGEATIINAVVQMPSDIQSAASTVSAKARAIRAEVLEAFPNNDIHITGVASLSAAFEEAGVRDSSTLIPLVYLFILIVMFFALRSISSVFASLTVIALSTLFGMGVGGWGGVELTPISLSAPTIILTIAVADAIHLISGIRTKMREGLGKREAIIASTGLNFTPIMITSITTIVGFLTLNFSDSPPFHHLGNISAAGIFAAWILSVTFLPAILSLLPLNFSTERTLFSNLGVKLGLGKPTDETPRTQITDRVAEFVIERPREIMIGTFVFCFAMIAAVPTMQLNDQWSQYFGKSLEFRKAIDAADPYFGSDNVEFVLDPGSPGAVVDPAFLKTVDAFTEYLRSKENDVAHVFALSDIMKRVNKNLNSDDPVFYQIPDDQTLASQYLLVYELSLPYGLDLNNRVDIDRQSTRVTASMKDISTERTKDFLSETQAWWTENGNGFGYTATGSKVLFSFVAQRNIEAMFQGALYLILAIFVILAISFRSVSVGAISILPNALPILTTFGVWALLVGVVGFSVAAVGAVAVGLVVDFTVHFLSKYLRARREDEKTIEDAVRYAFKTAGAAIFVTTVILAAGFAVLVTSSFKLNADLGLLTALAVIFAMLINLLLLPSLFLTFGKRGADGERIDTDQTAVSAE
ncbi:MAG: efflux RND transporter permease subunit [Pseudomonadota bacterium]